jgi:hypothetical protein
MLLNEYPSVALNHAKHEGFILLVKVPLHIAFQNVIYAPYTIDHTVHRERQNAILNYTPFS